jgi:hypothetical protein
MCNAHSHRGICCDLSTWQREEDIFETLRLLEDVLHRVRRLIIGEVIGT